MTLDGIKYLEARNMRLAISPRNIPLTEGDRQAITESRKRYFAEKRANPQVTFNLGGRVR